MCVSRRLLLDPFMSVIGFSLINEENKKKLHLVRLINN